MRTTGGLRQWAPLFLCAPPFSYLTDDCLFLISDGSNSTIRHCLVGTVVDSDFSSVQLSSVVADSLRRHEPQHTRPPCPSSTPRVHPNPCTSSQWCHPAISSSVIPFSSCPQSLPASGSFQMSQLFSWGGQSIGVPASASVLSRNIQGWYPLWVRTGRGTTDWFQIGKGARQGCILSPCLFNLYTEYIMRNTGLEEAQAGIKIAGEISITSDMQMTPTLWQKVKRS